MCLRLGKAGEPTVHQAPIAFELGKAICLRDGGDLTLGVVVTLEEHSIVGGLGSAVAECLAERSDVHPVFKRLGLPSAFSPYVGSQQYLLEKHGLSVDVDIVMALKGLGFKEAVSLLGGLSVSAPPSRPPRSPSPEESVG